MGRFLVLLFCAAPLFLLAWVGGGVGSMGAAGDISGWSVETSLPSPPIQGPAAGAQPLTLAGFKVIPVASYRLRARVLAAKRYAADDLAPVAPLDLALGWGVMADPALVGRLKITQGGRFYSWRAERDPGVPLRQIAVSSANVHIVPATPAIAEALRVAKPGAMVDLEGQLVDLRRGRAHWRTSRRRDDTGAGACEILLVEKVHAVEG